MIGKKIILTLTLFSMGLALCYGQEFPDEEIKMKSATPPQGMRGKPINLPDVSVIGIMKGYASDDKTDENQNKFEFDEVEVAFQGYIYPEMKADIFLALHKHGDSYEAEICEAKASFLRLAEGLSGEIGKIHVNFGRLNRMHTHHRPMVDQPPALTNSFGEHGLVGQGGTLIYLLPLPFFVQLEGGAWTVSSESHTHDSTTTAHADEFSMADQVHSGRLRTSFAPSTKSELEMGGSVASGKGAHYEEHKDEVMVWGADLTFRSWPTSYQRWVFQNEFFYLIRKIPAETLCRPGFYSFLNYRFNKYWDLGGRFDYAEGAFSANTIERAGSAILTYHLTETSHARTQYKYRRVESKNINELWFEFTFGIGPHSHELE